MALRSTISVVGFEGQVAAHYPTTIAADRIEDDDRTVRADIAFAIAAEVRQDPTWFLDPFSPVLLDLRERMHLYLCGSHPVRAWDFRPHQRQLPGMSTLPTHTFPLNGRALAARLRLLHLASLGELAAPMPPAHCHPMAMLALDVLAQGLEAWHGQTMTARVLETKLEHLVNRHHHLCKLRSMTLVTGELPGGFAGYVIDLVERLLIWFVGPVYTESPPWTRVERRERFGIRDGRQEACTARKEIDCEAGWIVV